MEATQQQTIFGLCRDCKWWTPPDEYTKGWGTCQLTVTHRWGSPGEYPESWVDEDEEGERVPVDWPSWLARGNHDETGPTRAYLETRPDFGCVQWTAKGTGKPEEEATD